MVIVIEMPFFLSLFVSFYKDCLILTRMGIGAQNDLGGTNVLPEKWLDIVHFQKNVGFFVQI